MGTPTLKKLLTRARDNLDASIASIEAGHDDQAHVSIRGAYDILAYIELKRELATAGPDAIARAHLASLPHHD